MTESTALTKKAQASSPPPSFSLLPAVHTIIDEASPELLREAMKLMTKNSVEDARTVTLMLDQAQYNVGDLDDSDDESSSLSIEYEGYIDSDPITDTLFQALLSRQAELQARNEREREERQAAMAKRRQKRRDQQRTMDKVIELDHERKEILDQASELKRDIHLLHERKAPKAAITELTRHYRIKDHAVDMYKQQILALSDIPVRHVHCEFCGEGFDANRNELGDCRRHTGETPLALIHDKPR